MNTTPMSPAQPSEAHGTAIALRTLSAVTILLLSVAPMAFGDQYGDFLYSANGSVTITGYVGTAENIDIPSSIDSKSVTVIGEKAFKNCLTPTNISIPDSVLDIRNSAFFGCATRTVDIGSNVTNIDNQAFAYCPNLVNVTLPDSVIDMGQETFMYCNALTEGTTGNNVIQVGDRAFYNCATMTNILIGTNVVEIGDSAFAYCNYLGLTTIPDSVLRISDNAFERTHSLEIAIGRQVRSIGDEAFWNSGLSSVVIPSSVTNVGALAFEHCYALQTITIEEGVGRIACSAFDDCDDVTTITLPASAAFSGLFMRAPFFDCTSLTNITVAAGNSSHCSIDGVLFDSTAETLVRYPPGKSATHYTVPDGVLSIGARSFKESLLASVTFADSVWEIKYAAFRWCHNLESVNIGSGVSVIDSSFQECQALSSIFVDPANSTYSSRNGVLFDAGQETLLQYPVGKTNETYMIPKGVLLIQASAFADCDSLQSITIPDAVTEIVSDAFADCSGLETVTIGSGVNNIGGDLEKGASVFGGCSSLCEVNVSPSNTTYSSLDDVLFDKLQETLVVYPAGRTNAHYEIPHTVTSVAYMACSDATNLTTVSIPSSVDIIRGNAFHRCHGLTSMMIPDSVTSIGNCAFSQCDSLASVKIGSGITNIEHQAFWNCDSLTSLTISANVTSIGWEAFANSDDLEAVCFEGDAPNYGTPGYGDEVFVGSDQVIVYYRSATAGWGDTFSYRPTALWPEFSSVQTHTGGLTLDLIASEDQQIVVEVCTNLLHGAWTPISTNTVPAGDLLEFTDTDWDADPSRYYRVVIP